MASTYTVNIGIEKPGTGDQSGTWGTTTNTNFDIIDQATNGVATVTLAAAGTSGSPNTLLINNGALSDGRNRFIEFNDGADLGATAYVQLDPDDAEKIVHIRNSLSGNRGIILFQGTYNASNDFIVPNGADVLVKFDGGGTGATVTDVNANLTVSQLSFIDGNKAVFGAGSDLEISHDGTENIIDSNSGTLVLRSAGAGTIEMRDQGSQVLAQFNDNSDVKLFYNNNEKLATTSTGVDVTGTVTADGLTVGNNDLIKSDGSIIVDIDSDNNTTGAVFDIKANGNTKLVARFIENNDISFYEDTGTTAKFFWDASTERLGIGTSSPRTVLDIQNSALTAARISFADTDVIRNNYIGMGSDADELAISADEDAEGANSNIQFRVDGSEAMRIDSSGNVLVGTTTTVIQNGTTAGTVINSTGQIEAARNGNVIGLNRLSTDGDIAIFQKDGSTVGSIGADAAAGQLYIQGLSTDSGFRFSVNGPVPFRNGSPVDNTLDFGSAGNRWDDIFATNGTIQTSDANEKQQIAVLTDAEITAAKAISQLFKTFKWNSAVEAKGDAARTHTGVISQDVQAAMTAAGLDAGDYAFFISSTWWETQTEVLAVEAVEAVDAVYEDVVIPAVEEELDEEGNVIVEAQPERTEQRLVSEAIEAVEAQEAYTRTDTYETAEEAPEGATERTRLGIRYPELLAFVGAATEQRLANIETRLAALEAN